MFTSDFRNLYFWPYYAHSYKNKITKRSKIVENDHNIAKNKIKSDAQMFR